MTGIKNLYKNSMLCRVISGFDKSIDKSIEKSAFLKLFGDDETTDDRFNKPKAKNAHNLLSKINASYLVGFVNKVCDEFTQINLRYFGIMLLIFGFGGMLGGVFANRGKTTVFASMFVEILSILLILINRPVNELLEKSVFFNWLKKLFLLDFEFKKGNSDLSRTYFVNIGVFAGLFSFAFGLVPATLAIFIAIAISIGFKFTSFCVIVLISILPFVPTMVMAGGCVALIGVLVIRKFLGSRHGLNQYTSSENVFVIVFCLVYIIGCIASVNVKSSLKAVLVYEAFMIFYFVIVKCIGTSDKFFRLTSCMVIASIPVAGFGIYQKFTGFDKANTWIDSSMFEEINGRVVSYFQNPNVFGEYLIILCMLALAMTLSVHSKRYKVLYFGTFLALMLSMVYTYSRGCWIGIVLAIAMFILILNRKVFLAFCCAGAVSVFFLPSSIITRVSSIGNLADSSTSYRVYIWKGTLRMLRDYWRTGVGIGEDAFNAIYPSYSFSSVIAPHAHNLYLHIMSEVGILGLVAFIALVIFAFKKLCFVIKNSKKKKNRIFAAALISGTTGFLVQGMFDNVWYNYRIFLLFWIVVAMASALYIITKKEYINDKSY